MLLSLNRCRVVPLYTEVDALRIIESRPAHKQCPARSLNYSFLTINIWKPAMTAIYILGLVLQEYLEV